MRKHSPCPLISIFAIGALAAFSFASAQAQEPLRFRGLYLGMKIKDAASQIPASFILVPDSISTFERIAPYPALDKVKISLAWKRGDCQVRVKPSVREFFARNPDFKYNPGNVAKVIPDYLEDIPSTSLELPACFFDAPGILPEEYAKQIVDNHKFLEGTLYVGARVGIDCRCWIGILESGELITVSSEESVMTVSAPSEETRNKLFPPKAKF